jgi:hypothetical protein
MSLALEHSMFVAGRSPKLWCLSLCSWYHWKALNEDDFEIFRTQVQEILNFEHFFRIEILTKSQKPAFGRRN